MSPSRKYRTRAELPPHFSSLRILPGALKAILSESSSWQSQPTLRLTYRRQAGRWSAKIIFKLQRSAERKTRAALRCRRIVRHPVAALILRCALLLAVTFVLTHETQQTAKKVDHQ